MTFDDDFIRKILTTTRTIAMVGWSANPSRPSHGVARFLRDRGIRVIPVNPGHAGHSWDGQPIYARLSDIPTGADVDMVDIFRRSDAVPAIVDEALGALPNLRTIWMQLGVSHDQAAEKARSMGIAVVQNHCPKIEFRRLGL